MTDQQKAMVQRAQSQYGPIQPPFKADGDWSKAFTTYNDHWLLWFDNEIGSTQILKERIRA